MIIIIVVIIIIIMTMITVIIIIIIVIIMIKYLFVERHKRERQGIIKYDIMFYNVSNKNQN